MTSSNGDIFRVTGPLCGEFTGPGEFPAQRPVTRSFDVFFDLRMNKRLSKQPWGWWFETSPWSLWRQCNVVYPCGVITYPYPGLTHWGRDKMADISQTTFASAFSWMKMFEFRLKFHWSLCLRVIWIQQIPPPPSLPPPPPPPPPHTHTHTHTHLVRHICLSELDEHWLR